MLTFRGDDVSPCQLSMPPMVRSIDISEIRMIATDDISVFRNIANREIRRGR